MIKTHHFVNSYKETTHLFELFTISAFIGDQFQHVIPHLIKFILHTLLFILVFNWFVNWFKIDIIFLNQHSKGRSDEFRKSSQYIVAIGVHNQIAYLNEIIIDICLEKFQNIILFENYGRAKNFGNFTNVIVIETDTEYLKEVIRYCFENHITHEGLIMS